MQTVTEFITQNRPKWDRLTYLLNKKKRSFDESREMGTLYQIVVEDLSFSQSAYPESDAEAYLNQLIRDSHLAFYHPGRTRWQKVVEYFATTFPLSIVKFWKPMLMSIFVFLAAIFISFFMVIDNQELAQMFLSHDTYEMAKNDLQNRNKFGNFDNIPESRRTALSLQLWIHNSRVSIYCYALGITFGIGTLYFLVLNGFMLGALTAFYILNGHGTDFLSIIMVHGSIELTAIVFAGGAGFAIAGAVLFPGREKRVNKLKRTGRTSMLVMAGVILMLLISGLIEGLITPMKLPIPQRMAIIALNTTLLVLYISIGMVFRKKDTEVILR